MENRERELANLIRQLAEVREKMAEIKKTRKRSGPEYEALAASRDELCRQIVQQEKPLLTPDALNRIIGKTPKRRASNR